LDSAYPLEEGHMPLSEHEQRMLEEIERHLAESDPRLVESVSKATLSAHALRRIRWGLLAFLVGFVLLFFFVVSSLFWVAVVGFAVMLGSGLLVYHYLKRMGRDQLRAYGQRGGHFSLTAALARLADRLRRPRGSN
jgi:ABC-type bacteriocin/lantibiotic exporter with double-glycine peptidase domain